MLSWCVSAVLFCCQCYGVRNNPSIKIIILGHSIRHIAFVVTGSFLQFHHDDLVEHLLTDSRKLIYPQSTLFFALDGSRRNGRTFIQDLYMKGVRNFVINQELEPEKFPEANFILVPNSLKALQEIAAFHRGQFDLPVVGITGSNGKTIVKEWLNQLLEDKFQIVRSPRSYNSRIGVPLSIWQINPIHNLALIEAGISQAGEMSVLQEIIKPTIGIFTNIGEAHDQGFANISEKITEKLSLFKHAEVLIFPSEQAELNLAIRNWHELYPSVALFSVGKSAENRLQVRKTERSQGVSKFRLQYGSEEMELEIGFDNEVAIQNALSCISMMLYLGIPPNDLQKRLNRLNPLSMRLELKTGINHTSIINDSYSADISSLKMALDFLNQQGQHSKKTVILSDILETGREPAELYREVAGLLKTFAINRLIGVGKELEANQKIFRHVGIDEAVYYPNTHELINDFASLDFKDEAILIKGARIFGFEKIDQLLALQVHETMLEVNLDAMSQNLRQYQQILKPATKIMAMVKAFSYGTGGFEIARLLEFHKVDYLAVAYIDEGISLRKSGISMPIIVINTEENALAPLAEWQLEPVVFSLRGLVAMEKFIKQEALSFFPIHIELETGMNRLGFSQEELPALLTSLNKNKFQIRSVFSHLAASEEKQQDAFTATQFVKYQLMADLIEQSIGYRFVRHISNSAAAVRHPEYQLDMVRLGIGLYGIDPANSKLLDLREVGSLKTTIAQIKHLTAGETIGYNRRGVADRAMKTGTLRLGYADGYPRNLGNGIGKIWYKGKLVPTIGSICMDMMMIDLSDIEETSEGDEVLIFGNELPVSDVAAWAETIPYDLLAGISHRVKRVYFE